MTPIRILSLTFAEDASQNAQQLNVREMVRRLDPARFEVTLLSEGNGPSTIAALPHVRLLHLPKRLRSLRILWDLLTGSYDVLFHPHAGLPEALYVALPHWFPGRSTRIVVGVEGDLAQLDEIPARIRKRLERLFRRADGLFPITDYVGASLHARVGRVGPVIPVGVDLETFRPRQGPREPGPLRVLCVGKVKSWKRPELARYAAERLPNHHFTWIGTGELLEQERGLAPSNLRFLGSVDHAGLPDLYRRADVLLHPSRMEGLPKVILEALASGLPVVAFDDYEPRYLTEGGAGFVVRSPDSMVGALRTLAADDGARTLMGHAARSLAQRFSWGAVTAQWARVFETEATVRRSPPAHDGTMDEGTGATTPPAEKGGA